MCEHEQHIHTHTHRRTVHMHANTHRDEEVMNMLNLIGPLPYTRRACV